jgi:ectoine hydroxylase-related dioxygenase (phytanoyl-CoA dioxygenase family)
MESPITAPAGSLIVFDSMLFHRAGINRSQAMRRGVNNVFALPFLKQQIVLPALLDGKWSDDPWLRRLLGYESDPPRSPAEYREQRTRKS